MQETSVKKENALVAQEGENSVFVDRIEPLPMGKVILNGVWGLSKAWL